MESLPRYTGEALNSNSSVYQFLCLFKIVEALRARRKKLQRAANATNAGYAAAPFKGISNYL